MFLSNSQQSYGIIPRYHPATNRKFSLYQYSPKRSCYMAVTLASVPCVVRRSPLFNLFAFSADLNVNSAGGDTSRR